MASVGSIQPAKIPVASAAVSVPSDQHQKSARIRRSTAFKQHAQNRQCLRPCAQQGNLWSKGIVAAGAALAVALSPALAAEDLTITFKASRNPEIRQVQKALVEGWGERQQQRCLLHTTRVCLYTG